MKNKYWVGFILLLNILKGNDIHSQPQKKNSSEVVQIAWLDALKNPKNLQSFYAEQSGLMIKDQLFIGSSEIRKQLASLEKEYGELKNYTETNVYQIRAHQKLVLGMYTTSKGLHLSTIIGWKNNGKWFKEFEAIYKNTNSPDSGIDSVNNARQLWEKHSNHHRPDLIMNEVFSKNGKYFNRGKLFTDQHLIDAYAYMTNTTFHIKLEPLHVVQISEDVIFDIGTYDAIEKGLYALIWKKELSSWKILLDFNF